MKNKPYLEYFKNGYYYRTFNVDLDNIEFVWHRDSEDRIVESLENTDWLFQFDNKLPMNIDGKIFIPKNTYHRIIKGSNRDLKIKMKKI